MKRAIVVSLIVATCAGLVAPSVAVAEEVEKRLRIGGSIGYLKAQSSVDSEAANILTLTDYTGAITSFYVDPRSDLGSLGKLEIRPALRALVSLQYAINRFFLIEAVAGYQQGPIEDIEVQAQFEGVQIPSDRTSLYGVYRVPAGTMTQIPMQVNALVRFRPKAKLNPYLGIGMGYTFVGFDPSNELDKLSRDMDVSQGRKVRLQPYPGGYDALTDYGSLTGSSVLAPDYWEWHLDGGFELSFKRKWVVFVDMQYQWATQEFELKFNGQDSLGYGVPSRQALDNSAFASLPYGPVEINEGGLIDGGRLVPSPDVGPLPPGTTPAQYCAEQPSNCRFDAVPDGVVDPGYYYVQGGKLNYGGIGILMGVRFTF